MKKNELYKHLSDKYGLTAEDYWELKRGGKTIYVMLHDSVMKVAELEGVIFEMPHVYTAKDDIGSVAMVGCARLKDKVMWATGESSKANTKNAYPFAMAEKRLKDRLTLMLVGLYDLGVYSDVEADAFKNNNSKSVMDETPSDKQINMIRDLYKKIGEPKTEAQILAHKQGMTRANASKLINELKLIKEEKV